MKFWNIDKRKHGETKKGTAYKLMKLQGVPKKTLVSVQRLLEVLKNDLQIKVG